jgi:uncharacterized protein (TIGR02118 family)
MLNPTESKGNFSLFPVHIAKRLSLAAGGRPMVKLTVLYGHPTSPESFEKYYVETHLPLAYKMKGYARFELTEFLPGPGGEKPAFYRMAELLFADEAQMQATMGSPEGRVAVGDLANFASGGVTVLVGKASDVTQ